MSTPPTIRPPAASDQAFDRSTANHARILIVEDDYLVGTFSEDALRDAGYEIVGMVASGEEAVEQGLILRPDLVLMDIRLAGEMTGVEAALKLRAHGIPSIFASAHSDSGTRASGDAAKPEGWLAKPYSASEVVAAVSDAMARLRRH